jgi:hypothetical protein
MVGRQDVAEALTRSKATVIEQSGSDALATVAAFQIIGVGDHRVATQGVPRKTSSSGVSSMSVKRKQHD